MAAMKKTRGVPASAPAQPWQVFEPPSLHRVQARREIWLAIRRRPFTLRLQGAVWRLRPVAVEPLRAKRGWWRIGARSPSDSIVLHVQAGALSAWLQERFKDVPLADLDPEVLPLLVESGAADMLADLEAHGMGPLRVRSAEPVDSFPQTCTTAFEVQSDRREPFAVVLDIDGPASDRLDQAIGALPADPRPRRDLAVTGCFRVGAAVLTKAELDDLGVGDTILMETSFLQADKIAFVAGESLAQTCSVKVDGVVLDGPLRVVSGSSAHFQLAKVMSDPSDALTAADDGSLSDLRIRVIFELGRVEVPLAVLETLGEGHVFDLDKAEQTVVDIIAGGRRIGTGSLVRVADTIGVRVNQLIK
jgi:type III secretion protein Q